MAVDSKVVREHLEEDQAMARVVVANANHQWLEGPAQPVDVEPFRTTEAVRIAVGRHSAERQEALRETSEFPYYTKVVTDLEDEYDDTTGRVTFYITRAPQR